MDGGNMLSGGVDILNEVKEYVLELNGYQVNIASLAENEEKLEKSIKNLEKSIADEIQSTTRKRRDEIDDAFEKQIDKIRARIKKIKDKRDKKKSIKVSERIELETASLKGENSNLKSETKALYRQNNIPSYYNTKIFYALHSPSCFTDFLIVLIALVTVLLIIPCGIYFLILPQEKILFLVLTYVITVLLFGSIYFVGGNRIKEQHSDVVKQVKIIRSNIRKNKIGINLIKKNIRKDRDESTYDLQNFDEEIGNLEKEAAEVAAQKKEALDTFDATTKNIIATEIQGVSEEKLSGLKENYEKTDKEIKKTEDMIKALTIKLASEYEPFIGKDLMTLEQLDSLINIIQAGNASTISEAIAFYRQFMNGTSNNKDKIIV